MLLRSSLAKRARKAPKIPRCQMGQRFFQSPWWTEKQFGLLKANRPSLRDKGTETGRLEDEDEQEDENDSVFVHFDKTRQTGSCLLCSTSTV